MSGTTVMYGLYCTTSVIIGPHSVVYDIIIYSACYVLVSSFYRQEDDSFQNFVPFVGVSKFLISIAACLTIPIPCHVHC